VTGWNFPGFGIGGPYQIALGGSAFCTPGSRGEPPNDDCVDATHRRAVNHSRHHDRFDA
jgi:hypothetical protein